MLPLQGLILLTTGLRLLAVQQGSRVHMMANPIRKVVNVLQAMEKKVREESGRDAELNHKFMCYCKTADVFLSKSIAAAEDKAPHLRSTLEATQGQQSQLEEDLKKTSADREAAKTLIAEATGCRKKEAAAYVKLASNYRTNLAALRKAVTAISKGGGEGFLQIGIVQAVRKIVLVKEDIDDEEKQLILAFLSQTADAPSGHEILGMLKQIHDEMSKSLTEATSMENAAIEQFEELLAAKTKEIKALTADFEKKTERVGEIAVKMVDMKNDLSDMVEGLAEDKQFLANLDAVCASKKQTHERNKKIFADELTALADTIKILNDDDALELFKKTLPSSGASLLQLKVNAAMMRDRALSVIQEGLQQPTRSMWPQLDFILLALHGKKVGFEKVIHMIDKMIGSLEKEQQADTKKKKHCTIEFDYAEDKKKNLERFMSDAGAAMEDAKEGIATLNEEIKSLQDGLVSLDESVAQATQQRKKEHGEYSDFMASNAAAKEVLQVAKNRLNKCYNPKLYDAQPQQNPETAALEQVNTQIRGRDMPQPPPESTQPYSKKTEESIGAIEMIDLCIKDLDKEMVVAEANEKESQAAYETTISDSTRKRLLDSKALADKESAKADNEDQLQIHKDNQKSHSKELSATTGFIHSLHQECDFLIKYFSVRKEARRSEIDALQKAKAVLSGADFALVQTSVRRFVQRRL